MLFGRSRRNQRFHFGNLERGFSGFAVEVGSVAFGVDALLVRASTRSVRGAPPNRFRAGALHAAAAEAIRSRRFGFLSCWRDWIVVSICQGAAAAARLFCKMVQQHAPFLLDGIAECKPGAIARIQHARPLLLLEFIQVFGSGDGLLDNPFSHFSEAIMGALPFESFRGLIAFLAAGRRMSLGLGQLGYMHDGGFVIAPDVVCRRAK